MPQSPICGMDRKSIKPPKKPNDYKAENCGWKGVFGMAGNGILPAGICEPCRAFPEGLPGRYGGCPGGVRGGGHRRADQGPKPPSPLPSSGSGAVLAGGFGKKSRLDPSPHHHHHADHHPVRSGAGVSGLSGYTQPHGIRPPPKP